MWGREPKAANPCTINFFSLDFPLQKQLNMIENWLYEGEKV